MSIQVKPISNDAKAMLATLKTDPRYVSHTYDETNSVIVVTIKKWFGRGDNVKGLVVINTDYITSVYVIPYAYALTGYQA